MPGRAERFRSWVPRWWRGEGGTPGAVLHAALWPAEQLFRGAVVLRNAAYEHGVAPARRAGIPVVSVGNLAVGGAGKTPFTAWLARRLAAQGHRPAVVLRGYGGDEVLVHQELNPTFPVIANADRRAAVLYAENAGCTVAVLDDGFQHRALARDVDLALVAVESWSDDLRLLPRGPWREPLHSLRRADLVVLTRKSSGPADAARVQARLTEQLPTLSFVICHLAPTALLPLHPGAGERPLAWLAGADVLAVASLADPRPFADQLGAAGARVALAAFPDHHEFSRHDAHRIVAEARGRPMVVTRKEAVKLRPLLDPAEPVWVLEQTLVLETGAELLDAILQPLAPR